MTCNWHCALCSEGHLEHWTKVVRKHQLDCLLSGVQGRQGHQLKGYDAWCWVLPQTASQLGGESRSRCNISVASCTGVLFEAALAGECPPLFTDRSKPDLFANFTAVTTSWVPVHAKLSACSFGWTPKVTEADGRTSHHGAEV